MVTIPPLELYSYIVYAIVTVCRAGCAGVESASSLWQRATSSVARELGGGGEAGLGGGATV